MKCEVETCFSAPVQSGEIFLTLLILQLETMALRLPVMVHLYDHNMTIRNLTGWVINTASVSYRPRPSSSAASASAPRRRSPSTGPASHPAPASSSRSSANTRPPSPHPGSMPSKRRSRGPPLWFYLALRPRSRRRCRCWKGAHVLEPLVNQLILNGKHLTALLW